MSAVILVACLALAGLAAGCIRLAGWHMQESHYWSDIAWRVRLNPELDLIYRPILRWAQSERPSVRTRLSRWQSPEDRMGGAS